MIAFDSPEGRILRDVGLSRSAIFALWVTSLEMCQMDWADWARAQPIPGTDPNKIALQFLHAAALGNAAQGRLIATVLKTLPPSTQDLFYVRSALALAAMIFVQTA